jgi:hypothetical protein
MRSQESNGRTRAWSTMPSNDVMKRQPMLAASTKPTASGSRAGFTSA